MRLTNSPKWRFCFQKSIPNASIEIANVFWFIGMSCCWPHGGILTCAHYRHWDWKWRTTKGSQKAVSEIDYCSGKFAKHTKHTLSPLHTCTPLHTYSNPLPSSNHLTFPLQQQAGSVVPLDLLKGRLEPELLSEKNSNIITDRQFKRLAVQHNLKYNYTQKRFNLLREASSLSVHFLLAILHAHKGDYFLINYSD